jgi:hypothetical protein
MSNLVIKQAFNDALERQGFKKKSGSWYLPCDETVLVANLQKFEYGDRYFVNLAIWLEQLGSADYPKEHHCHIRIRFCRVAGREIDAVFDATNTALTDDSRRAQILSCMESLGIPFLRSCSTVASAAQQFSAGRLAHAFVHKNVKALFTT